MDINLQSLNLQSKWPKLARIQDEVKSLEKRAREAETEVSRLRAELGPAREKDLDLEAKAVREGKDAPEAKHEPAVTKKLERAGRDRDVMARALEAARTDLGVFLQQHRAELFADVVEQRAQIARDAAEAARTALQAYGRYEDLFYTVKALQPPVVAVDNNAPAQRLTQTVIGIATTQSGPARGETEAALRHVIALGTGPGQEGEDAAA